MKRPEFRPFAREDFPDAPWIEKLIRPLNTVLGAVATGLGNGLTLGENLNAEVRTLDVTTRDEWAALSLQNGWAIYGTSPVPSYRVAGGRVELRGVAKAGTLNATLAALASHPPATHRLHSATGSTTGAPTTPVHVRVSVSVAGAVATSYAPTGLDWVSLDGIGWDAGGSFANPAFPVRFTTRVKGKVAGVWLLRCVELDGRNELPVNDSLSVGWAQDGAHVQLTGVAGLAAGRTYRLTLAVIGG